MQLETGTISVEDARTGIRDASTAATEWLNLLNTYYKWSPTPPQRNDMNLYYPATGLNRTTIEWETFKRIMDTNDGRVCNYLLRPGSGARKMDQFEDRNNAIKKMTDTIRYLNARTAPPPPAPAPAPAPCRRDLC